MEPTFTIEQITKYLHSKDSYGDAIHFLSAENILKANEPEDDSEEEDY